MELTQIREQLDEIDKKLTVLLEQRMELCEKVAEYKIQNHKPVLDEAREQQKIKAVRSLVRNEQYQDAVEHMFEQIMRDSRALQTDIMEKSSTSK